MTKMLPPKNATGLYYGTTKIEPGQSVMVADSDVENFKSEGWTLAQDGESMDEVNDNG